MKRTLVMIMTAAAFALGCTSSLSPENVRIADYKDGKSCAISFTFDDGMKEHYTIVAPELEKRGWRGTFWLCCAWIHDDPQLDTTHITWSEVKDMHARGHEMSNHSWSHPNLTELTPEEAWNEIKRNDIAIEKHTGVSPVTFCFPYNARTPALLRLASEGRAGTRKEEFWLGGQHSPDEYLHKQVADALASRSWIAGMTHGINYGYDCYEDPADFTRFLDYVKEREDSIWVGTFKDVAAYKKAAESTQLDIKADGRSLFITPSLYLNPAIFDTLLTMEVITGGKRIKADQDGQPLEVTVRGDKAMFSFNPYGGEIRIRR